MRHVFIETNWVVAYAAPAHHKIPAALELFDRAASGEIKLHLPVICISEARRPIFERFQSRNEADRVRQFLLWARDSGMVNANEEEATRRVLDRMEGRVKADLEGLDEALNNLRAAKGVEIFNLSQKMLERCAELAHAKLDLQPFDQAILAATLVISASWIRTFNPGTRTVVPRNHWQNCMIELGFGFMAISYSRYLQSPVSGPNQWNKHTHPTDRFLIS